KPVPEPGPRTARAHRDRQNPAYPHQRSRCPGRRDRRTLQTSLADRIILSLGQAQPQNPTLPRNVRKRRAHSNRNRTDRVPAAARRPRRAERRAKPAHLHPPDRAKPHAPAFDPPTPRTAATDRQRFTSVEPQSMPNLNRTAMASCRASTSSFAEIKTWMAGTSPRLSGLILVDVVHGM